MPETFGGTPGAGTFGVVIRQTFAEIAANLGCSRLLILSYTPREGLLRGGLTVGFQAESLRSLNLPVSEFPAAERVLRTRRPLAMPPSLSLPASLASHFSGETALIPLELGGSPLGVLIGQMEAGVAARSEAWERRAQEMTARGALALELERVDTALQDSLRLRVSTRSVAAAILEGHPLHEVAALLTETIALQLNEPRVALFLPEESGQYRPVGLRNVSAEYAESITRITRPMPIMARATATGLPYHARHVQEDPLISEEARALYRRENITSVLLAILQRGEQVKGTLVVYPQTERVFTPAELSAFQGFADMATLGVALTQQMEQQRDLAMMEERNRLAREIHDTLAQSLAGLALQLETTQSCLIGNDLETARELLTAARALAKKTLEDTRRAVQGLSPASLDHRSAGEAIAEAAQQFEQEMGIPAPFLPAGEERPLDAEQRATLLRIAQESLTNIRKHAQARRVRVGLQFQEKEVLFLVEDDGVGFDQAARPAPGPGGGYGLFGMSERARLVGGEVRIESTVGWGTVVRATLPYRAVSSPLPREPVVAPPAASELPTARPSSSPQAGAIRVLIADDHTMVRQGLRAVLEATGELTVIGEAADGEQAVTMTRTLRPDVILMDVQMPNMDGLEALRRIRAEQPNLPVVILTTFQTDESVQEALRFGARGYLLKDADPASLLQAVRAAHRGETLLSPAVTERLSVIATGQADARSDANLLNEREREVLQLVAQGARNKEIAAHLFLATSTVEYHLSNIYSKLGVSNRAEAVRQALERGLLGK